MAFVAEYLSFGGFMGRALSAGSWGFVGGISLLIGAVVGLFVPASKRMIAIIMAIGAGVLVSFVLSKLQSCPSSTGVASGRLMVKVTLNIK